MLVEEEKIHREEPIQILRKHFVYLHDMELGKSYCYISLDNTTFKLLCINIATVIEVTDTPVYTVPTNNLFHYYGPYRTSIKCRFMSIDSPATINSMIISFQVIPNTFAHSPTGGFFELSALRDCDKLL